VTIARFSGYSVPLTIVLPLWACSLTAFVTFWILCAEKTSPSLCVTAGRISEMAHHFPAIRNSTGMALKIQLNAFIEKALDHHLMHGGLDEEFYISTLLHKAGLQSAIGLTLTQTAYNSLIRGITPLSYFLSRAKADGCLLKRHSGLPFLAAGPKLLPSVRGPMSHPHRS
jgi:hypothetical protein